LIFFRHFVELSSKTQPLLDYCSDLSRDLKETTKNDNSAWEIDMCAKYF